MNLRIQLPCWVSTGLLFSACATLETEGSGSSPDQVPDQPGSDVNCAGSCKTVFSSRGDRASAAAETPVCGGEDLATERETDRRLY
jgi:hypothetical protein